MNYKYNILLLEIKYYFNMNISVQRLHKDLILCNDLKEEFNITIDTDDIVDFSSFIKGFEILEKYGVKF